MQLFLSLLLVCSAHSLSLRTSHQMTSHLFFNTPFIFTLLNPTNLIILALLILAGYILIKCYCCNNQSNETHVVVIDRNNNTHVIQTSNRRQKQRGRPQPLKLQQANQPQNALNSGPQSYSQFQQWQPGNDFLKSPLKQNAICLLCCQLYKNGERPRLVISCPNDHIFHISCLDSHRQRIVSFMDGNGLYKCPQCKESYSPTVKLYCNACRCNMIQLPLSELTNSSGNIKMDKIQRIYGDCCQNCRVV